MGGTGGQLVKVGQQSLKMVKCGENPVPAIEISSELLENVSQLVE